MSKLYSQESFFDTDGNVVIRQFTETERPSGLIVSQHISTVLVVGQLSTGDLVERMNCDFYYSPTHVQLRQGSVGIARSTPRFSVVPQASRGFCEQSATAIVAAFHALTSYGVLPHVQFETEQQAENVADDDRRTLQEVSQLVIDTINGVDRSDPLPSGQYL